MSPDPRISPYIDNAIKGAERGTSLTQRMLAFARRQELEIKAVDIAELVRGMSGLIARSLGSHFTVSYNMPVSLPQAQTDPNQLESALLNLVINARDAMSTGVNIVISAAVERLDASSEMCVVLSVTDEGNGMDEATLAKAAEPFFTTKDVGKGTGLGLPMVAGMAEQSGGKLVLKSKPGAGTRAEIWLPVAQNVGESLAPEPVSETIEVSPTSLTIFGGRRRRSRTNQHRRHAARVRA